MANIWDAEGKLIGSVEDLGNGDANTYDEHGQPLGKVRQNGTFTNTNQKISWTKNTGLTFTKKPKQ
jgi:YD repeat-containing protein